MPKSVEKLKCEKATDSSWLVVSLIGRSETLIDRFADGKGRDIK